MAVEWDLYLESTGPTGELSSFGRKTTINKKEKVRQQRAADGTLKQDIMYVKHEFVLSYDKITESAIDTFDYWYSYYQTNKTPLTLYVYTGPSTYDTYEVIPKPVDKTRVVKADDNLFSGVKFVMIEV